MCTAESSTQAESMCMTADICCLMLQNGTLKGKIHGANIPSLLESLAEWVTPLPGLDDLEVRPITTN